MLDNLDDYEIDLPKNDAKSRICQLILKISKEYF